ncbi:MAG: hypothetical protein A3J38_01670 [Gammaproteobacteria bacterium RIFCSPHIGHO2_12_FULL_45_9]|nr:MAG: hypothetical protein A3J38_01670 [Gammaproteobacteria bacterium RIFCSPHIGHO2_12_FULL_45_9]
MIPEQHHTHHPALSFWEHLIIMGRGAGQVFFQENALTGLFFIIAIFVAAYHEGNWGVGIGGLTGLVLSTYTAILLKFDRDLVKAGLMGFNGILVGCALPTFLNPSLTMWIYLIVASVAVVVIQGFCMSILRRFSLPSSTWPFVLTGWIFMLAAYHFSALSITGLPSARLYTITHLNKAAYNILFMHIDHPFHDIALQFLHITFLNIAQAFLLNYWLSGVIIVIGLLMNTRVGTLLAIMGSMIAILIARIGYLSDTAMLDGLYGFSATLTAMAIGCVFIPWSRWSFCYAICATIFTVILNAAMVTLLSPVGIPPFTGPYVLSMWIFLAAWSARAIKD